MTDVTYRWRYQDEQGSDLPGPEMVFVDQSEAETWLSTTWSALLADGIDQVTLMSGAVEIYGPMSLHEPS